MATDKPTQQIEDWPWDWDFRNQRPYDDYNQEPISEEFPQLDHARGRSLERERSSDSLLSQRLSEANRQHERDRTAHPRSSSMRCTAESSPFRAGSPLRQLRDDNADDYIAAIQPLQTPMLGASRSDFAMQNIFPPSLDLAFADHFDQASTQNGLSSKGKGKATEPETKDGQYSGSSSLSIPQKQSGICPHCSKPIDRPSNMRKHVKRHTQAYGCTSDSCTKTFGSKSDWKRHETRKHLQVSFWLCGEEIDTHLDSGEYFTRICAHTRCNIGAFTSHLIEQHGLASDAVKEKMERYRVGDDTFWCGFCRAVIDVETAEGKIDRFDHIENHFLADGKKIEMWMHCKYL